MNKLLPQWNSVHAKLLRTIVVSFAVGFAVAGLILFFVINNLTRDNSIEGLSVTGKIIADRSAASLIFFDHQSAEANLATARNRQSINYLCLYDGAGQLFSSYPSDNPANICEAKSDPVINLAITESQGFIELFIPVVDQSEFLGHLYIEASTQALLRTQWLLKTILAFALLVSLLIACLMGSKLVKRSLLPLDALFKTSTLIAENPLADVRAEKISDDEVGRVVDVFNTMLDNLAREAKALMFSENRFRTLAENAPIGVFLKNEDGSYEYTNSRWSEITGLDHVNAASFISHIDPSDRSLYNKALTLAQRSGQPQVIEYNYTNHHTGECILMEYISPVSYDSDRRQFIGSLLDVTELKDAQMELEKLAFYDPLTQLPNRRFFRDHLSLSLARAQKRNRKMAMYMTDLDEFKKVNDSLGHDVGDQLLVDIAQRLRASLHEGDVVSRMGGDEFMILLDNIEDPTRLDNASQRILEALRTTARSDNQVIQVTGSVGIAIFPTDAKTPEELLRYADMALYNAKGGGGARVSYYSHELDKKIKEKVRIEQKLRQAIDEAKLEIYIQPQYIAGTRQVCGGEVLARWYDEEEGFISPDAFIPLAEDSGLIFEIGDYVFDRVLKLLAEDGHVLKQIGMQGLSVNLSARRFYSPEFSTRIAEKFDSYGVDPAMVEFEITETTVMDDIDQAIVIMESLRALGCALSIDDFGTGYSSLSNLKRFPINRLKIDKSFIRDIPDDQNDVEISCAIIAMAHKLGLSVVAEGVETELQARFLAAQDCEYLQGYYFDQPMPLDELLARVRQPKVKGRKTHHGR